MERYFSASVLLFYPKNMIDDGSYGNNLPGDLILLTEEEAATYWNVQPPAGFTLGSDVDGRPVWVEIPPVVIPLPDLQDSKRVEMRNACSDEITRSSYQSGALGAVHNYDCRLVDQVNLKIRYDVAVSTSASEPLWASDGTRYQWTEHTAAEIMDVMIDMNEHIKAAQVKLASKLAAVDAATTAEQINAIVW